MVKPIILAGGNGTRLWPMSRTDYPKQFHPFDNSASLFQETVMRFTEDPIVVCNEAHRFIALEQLANIEYTGTIVLEENANNTAPAIAIALRECNTQDIVVIMPSDHYISDGVNFDESISQAVKLAEQGHIVTLGIHPTRPATEYGYILPDKQLVSRFVEKPDEETASKFIEEGYLWNSGIFISKVETLLSQFRTHCPPILASVQMGRLDKLFKWYEYTGPSISFDHAIMEKTDIAAVVGMSCEWSDVGSWDAYLDATKNNDGNALIGDVNSTDCENTLVMSSNRKICTLGLKDLIVVDTPDALLVADRSYSQQVKHLVSELPPELTKSHTVVKRPWGSYESIGKGDRHQVKHLIVKPGQKLSLQLHYHRSEHWVVVSGTAEVTLSDRTFILIEGESVFIQTSKVHSLSNPGRIPLEIIEVQVGSYLGEDDIVRIDDSYGRA